MFRAWVPVAGVLLLIGFVPGMPNFCLCLLLLRQPYLTRLACAIKTPESHDDSVQDLVQQCRGWCSRRARRRWAQVRNGEVCT